MDKPSDETSIPVSDDHTGANGAGSVDKPKDDRLSINEIAQFAWESAHRMGELVKRGVGTTHPWNYYIDLDERNKIAKLVHNIIMEAANPNHAAVMQRWHDLGVGQRLEQGWRYEAGVDRDDERKVDSQLLPWSTLPELSRMRAIYFRQTVLALLPAWAGY